MSRPPIKWGLLENRDASPYPLSEPLCPWLSLTHGRDLAPPSGAICTGPAALTDKGTMSDLSDFPRTQCRWWIKTQNWIFEAAPVFQLLCVTSLQAQCVTSMSEEQGDTVLAPESQAGILVLAQWLFRAPPSAAFAASSCRSVFEKWEWLLHRLTRTTSTSRRTLGNGGETAWVEGTKEWGDRKEEGGGCPEGKLTNALRFALLVDCIRNTFFLFLVRSGGGGNNQLLFARRTHQGTFMRHMF